MLHCGIPLITGTKSEFSEFTQTLCFQSNKNGLAHLTSASSIPYETSLLINLLWGTLSNASQSLYKSLIICVGERKFHVTLAYGIESSMERKFHLWNFRFEERKYVGTKVR